MLPHMKKQKDRGVRFGRIFSMGFTSGYDNKCIKKLHRRRANSWAVFRAHEMGESLRVETTPNGRGVFIIYQSINRYPYLNLMYALRRCM